MFTKTVATLLALAALVAGPVFAASKKAPAHGKETKAAASPYAPTAKDLERYSREFCTERGKAAAQLLRDNPYWSLDTTPEAAATRVEQECLEHLVFKTRAMLPEMSNTPLPARATPQRDNGFAMASTHQPSNPGSMIMGFILLGVLGLLYFIPAGVAASRKHHNTSAIFVLNLFLGWTFLGWIAALVWSCTYTPASRA